MSNRRVYGMMSVFVLAVLAVFMFSDVAWAAEAKKTVDYGWLSLLPPLVAIVLAFITKEVLLSLFVGVWLGATILNGWNPWSGFFRTFDHYVLRSIVPKDGDTWDAAVIIFSLSLAGMAGVVNRSGGALAIARALAKKAKGVRGGQFFTWLMGLIIFFDDYANTLIVGTTLRPLTDRLRISREKLAFIVDATAAPVASWAIISTWVGYEVGLISKAFKSAHIQGNAYLAFINTIPFRFYSLGMVFMVLMIALLVRDYSSMYRAEVRTRTTGKVLRDGAVPLSSDELTKIGVTDESKQRALNAWIPILTMIIATFVGLWYNGGGMSKPFTFAGIREALGDADSSIVLIWASFLSSAVAIFITTAQGVLKIRDAMDAWVGGARSLMIAMMILVLAWSIGSICDDMHTADYVVGIAKGVVSPHLVPTIIFLVAMVISFSTGTSWGTMAILMPIAVPLAHSLGAPLYASMGAVLTGGVFGDHCSPISDTTIMSSMASGCDHIDHVDTQLPYAVSAAIVAIIFGYLPAGYGMGAGVSLLLVYLGIYIVVRLFGKKTDYASLGVDYTPDLEMHK